MQSLSSFLSKTLLFLVLLLPFLATPSGAHQPRWVEVGRTVVITAPEISKAYYGQLIGAPQEFLLRSSAPFELYLEILVPDLPSAKTDFRVDVLRDAEAQIQPLIHLNGAVTKWSPFFEKFSGDDYLRGPSSKTRESEGGCLLRVSNSDNLGKYVLVVGERESFPPAEIWNVIKFLPQLKTDFFEKSVWTAYFNYSGLFLLVLGVLVVGAGFLLRLALGKWVKNR